MPPDLDWQSSLRLLAEFLDRKDGTSRDALAARYRPLIEHWCRRSNLPPGVREDVAETILADVLAKVLDGKYDPNKARFRRWLKTVVRNALADVWRRLAQQPEFLASGDSRTHQLLERLADDGPSVEQLADALEDSTGKAVGEADRRLAQLIEQAGAGNWQVYLRVKYYNEPAAEVAESLGKSVGAVYVACSRVKKVIDEYRKQHQS